MIKKYLVTENCIGSLGKWAKTALLNYLQLNWVYAQYVSSHVSSWFWSQCSVGQDRGASKHLHWYALLDGAGSHCLRWEPRLDLRLQGNNSSVACVRACLYEDLKATCSSVILVLFQSDIWSLGITAIEMAEGAPRKSKSLINWRALTLHLCGWVTRRSIGSLWKLSMNESWICSFVGLQMDSWLAVIKQVQSWAGTAPVEADCTDLSGLLCGECLLVQLITDLVQICSCPTVFTVRVND